MTSLKGGVKFCFMDIDINFNFYSDTPKGKDPDSYSETLRKYHQFLWSKSLPNGSIFKLDIKIPKISPNLIHILFNGESNFEFINPSKRKIIEMAKKYLFKFSPFFKGQILKIKKK